MLAFRSRWVAAAALVGMGTVGAIASCGGKEFTLAPGADGGNGDGGVGDDGGPGPDALVEAEAGDPGFCANQPMRHFLCDDFDHRAVSDQKGTIWDDFQTGPLSDGQIDSKVFLSPPRAFLVDTLHAGIVNTEVAALLTKSIGHAKTVAISYDVMVEAYGANGGTDSPIFSVLVEEGSVAYALLVVSPSQSALLQLQTPDGGPPIQMTQTINAGFPTGTWKHVDIVLNLPQGALPGSATVAYDMSQVANTQLTPAPSTGAAIGTMSIGLYFKGNASQVWKLHYDNVVIDRGL